MYGRQSASSRQGPPAPFVPASQQQQQRSGSAAINRSKAIPIIAPSDESSSLENKTVNVKIVNANGSPIAAMNATSPSKAALSAKAASAAVFVPKGITTPNTSNATLAAFANPTPDSATNFDEQQQHGNPVGLMQDMNLNGPTGQDQFAHTQSPAIQHNPYLGTDSGRGTPNSFGRGGGYDTDGSNNMFDPTYMGPLPSSQTTSQDAHNPTNTQTSSNVSQPRGAKTFNPYENMNEYGELTTTAAANVGMNVPGQVGMDYYGGVNQHANGPANVKLRQPLQYHLYNPPMPHVSNLHPQHLSANAFFMSDEEREELQRKNEALHAGLPPPELGGPKLPEELHVYHSLVPLEPGQISALQGNGLVAQLINPRLVSPSAPQTLYQLTGASGEASRVFGYRCQVYKAQCTLDGKYYVLRRLENFRLSHEAAIGLVERWRRIRHPSIVSVREAFTTRAFGDSSIVFVYDYHPLAATLFAEHMVAKPPQQDRRTGRLQTKPMQISERTLWTYLCQLTNVVRTIHQHGLAARCIEPSKILLTGKNRIRINCCSIFDVIAYDPNASPSALQGHQAEDLVNMGKLLLSLACNNISAVQNIQRALDQITRLYSADLKSIIVWLLSPAESQTIPTINGIKVTRIKEEGGDSGKDEEGSSLSKTAEDLQRMLGVKYSEEFDSTLNHNDLLESGLSKELENARLVRLLCKFGFINERPEFDHDPRWSETGDRYIIKLFRDHVFHAVDSAGRPVVDLTHILTNLNKLDAGSLEKIMLTSRDEQSCLVVSYREIKDCIDSAFSDLSRSR